MTLPVTPPLVTVVVPALNAREWIGETLTSIKKQTYPAEALEIIVVDDGSSDGTAEEARDALSDGGIAHTLLRNAVPAGPSAARNRGWRQARGEWIQFLDADDLLAPSKLERQLATIPSHDPSVALVYSSWARLVLEEGHWKEKWPRFPTIGQDPLGDVLRSENFIQLGSALFSRMWLDRVNGFDESYRLIEDVDLVIRLIAAGATVQGTSSTQPLSFYRQLPNSLSRSNQQAFVDGCLRNARMVERHWAQHHELTEARASVLVDVYFFGMSYYGEHDPGVFRSLADDIRRLKPDFVPDYPPLLRLVTSAAGYAFAERCAIQWRRLKRSIRPWVVSRTMPSSEPPAAEVARSKA